MKEVRINLGRHDKRKKSAKYNGARDFNQMKVIDVRTQLHRLRLAFRNLSLIDEQMSSLNHEIFALKSEISAMKEFIEQLNHDSREIIENVGDFSISSRTKIDRLLAVANFTALNITTNREKLLQARNSPVYRDAYTVENPLVTIIIPTHTSPQVLWDRTLPSIRQQTYSNLEVIISVDNQDPEFVNGVREKIAQLNDPRLKILKAPPYPKVFPEVEHLDPITKERFYWFSSGNIAFAHAVANATGLWISPFSHDDAFDPNAIELLLDHTKANQLEYCYSPTKKIETDGTETKILSFPPVPYEFGVQGSLLNASLNFFVYEYRDSALDVPNDWGLVRSMMLAGVDIGFVETPVTTYFPSKIHSE